MPANRRSPLPAVVVSNLGITLKLPAKADTSSRETLRRKAVAINPIRCGLAQLTAGRGALAKACSHWESVWPQSRNPSGFRTARPPILFSSLLLTGLLRLCLFMLVIDHFPAATLARKVFSFLSVEGSHGPHCLIYLPTYPNPRLGSQGNLYWVRHSGKGPIND